MPAETPAPRCPPERCVTCDRVKAGAVNPRDPAAFAALCWREPLRPDEHPETTARAVADCAVRAVDWRTRAFAAEGNIRGEQMQRREAERALAAAESARVESEVAQAGLLRRWALASAKYSDTVEALLTERDAALARAELTSATAARRLDLLREAAGVVDLLTDARHEGNTDEGADCDDSCGAEDVRGYHVHRPHLAETGTCDAAEDCARCCAHDLHARIDAELSGAPAPVDAEAMACWLALCGGRPATAGAREDVLRAAKDARVLRDEYEREKLAAQARASEAEALLRECQAGLNRTTPAADPRVVNQRFTTADPRDARIAALADWFDRRAANLTDIVGENGVRSYARARTLRESAAYVRAALAGREIDLSSDAGRACRVVARVQGGQMTTRESRERAARFDGIEPMGVESGVHADGSTWCRVSPHDGMIGCGADEVAARRDVDERRRQRAARHVKLADELHAHGWAVYPPHDRHDDAQPVSAPYTLPDSTARRPPCTDAAKAAPQEIPAGGAGPSEARRFSDALTWIETHEPGGIQIVARALAAQPAPLPSEATIARAWEQDVRREYQEAHAASPCRGHPCRSFTGRGTFCPPCIRARASR